LIVSLDRALEKSKPEVSGVPWILDPQATQNYLDRADAFFSMDRADMMWAMDAGDEVADVSLYQGAELMENSGGYGYINVADAEVRQNFGGGIWGIPAGIKEKDPNPYKWIAYRRWVNAKLRERHQSLRDIVKTNNPSLYILGTHPPGIAFGLHPYEFSSQADLFDVVTHQIGYPGAGRAAPVHPEPRRRRDLRVLPRSRRHARCARHRRRDCLYWWPSDRSAQIHPGREGRTPQ